MNYKISMNYKMKHAVIFNEEKSEKCFRKYFHD